MEELRVPKRAVPVEIHLAGGTTVEVEIFVGHLEDRPERVSDLLEGPAAFLAAVRPGGGPLLLRRDAIAVARVDRAEESTLVDAAITPTEARVEVLLTDGTTLEGVLHYVPEADHARVLDHLNEPSRFFALRVGDLVALVAKAHVARVTPE